MVNDGGAAGASEPHGKAGAAVRSAMLWNFAHYGVSQLVAVAVFFYLAARLDPVVFGLFALATLLVDAFAAEARAAAVDLIVAGRRFGDGALASIYFALTAGAAAAYLCVTAACLGLGRVMAAPGLAATTAVVGLSILLTPRLAIHEALTVGELRFRALAIRNIVASLASAAAAATAVALKAPEWALVAQRLAAALAALAALARLAPWRPRARFDRAEASRFMRDFGKLWLSQIVTFGLARIPDLLVGARLGATELGLYRVAARLADMVQSAVTSPLAGLFIPVLSRFAGDARGQAEQYRQISALAALLTVPALAGLALVAADLVRATLAPQYAGIGPLAAMLAAAGLAAPFAHFRSGALVAAGRPGLAAGLALLDLGVTAAAVGLGAQFGLAGAAAGVLAASWAAGAVSALVTARALGARAVSIVAACGPPYLGAAAMGLMLAACAPLAADWTPAARLAAGVPAGAAVFLGYVTLFHRDWLAARLGYLRARRDGEAT